MNIVLFFQSTTRKSWREKLTGVHMYSRQRDWFVQVVESFASPAEIQRAIKEWSPVGCMVDRAMRRSAPPDHVFGDIPTVYLDQWSEKPSVRHPCLLHDSAATAAMAGAELLALDCASYAYIGTGKNYFWDIERLVRFRQDAANAGKPFRELAKHNIVAAIKALPKPCGILGANDACAAEAYRAAVCAGFEIPRDVAIAGIDNDELICETVTPGMTSAEPDFLGAGYRLAELLDDEIERKRRKAKRRKKPLIVRYGPARLVRRGSTVKSACASRRVGRAIEFIRRHACEPDISLDAVAAQMKCSRRLATMEFKKSTGRTIFDEIHDVRFQKACELLARTSLPIATIVVQCGYASESFIKKLFLKRTGMSMRDWRKRHTPNRSPFNLI